MYCTYLADAVGLVSDPSEVLRQQREVQREVAGCVVTKCMVDTGVDDVAAGEKRRPRRAAYRLHKVCSGRKWWGEGGGGRGREGREGRGGRGGEREAKHLDANDGAGG